MFFTSGILKLKAIELRVSCAQSGNKLGGDLVRVFFRLLNLSHPFRQNSGGQRVGIVTPDSEKSMMLFFTIVMESWLLLPNTLRVKIPPRNG